MEAKTIFFFCWDYNSLLFIVNHLVFLEAATGTGVPGGSGGVH